MDVCPNSCTFFNIYFKTMALQQLLMHASAFVSVCVLWEQAIGTHFML